MARTPELLLTQSVLDRLNNTDTWPVTRTESIRFLRNSIKQNLEWVLNTRRPPLEDTANYPHASRSVINYGLMDMTSLSPSSTQDRKLLIQNIAEVVEWFEPRLHSVAIRVEEGDLNRKELRFYIEAYIHMKPAPEEVTFSSVLDLTSGEYQLE